MCVVGYQVYGVECLVWQDVGVYWGVQFVDDFFDGDDVVFCCQGCFFLYVEDVLEQNVVFVVGFLCVDYVDVWVY